MSEHAQAPEEKEHKKSHGSHGAGAAHGGGHEEHEGAPEWLISFADNVTLMMGFFVIMTAVNMGPKGGGPDAAKAADSKSPPPMMLDTQIAIREAFNNPVNMNSMDPKEQILIQRMLERRGRSVAKQDGPRGDEHSVQSIRPSNYFKTCGAVPFNDGSAVLSDAAAKTAADIAGHLRGLRMIIDVRGHVSAAESFEKPDQGMQLSFNRALAVAKVLAEKGVDWRQMRVVSCADNDRIKPIVYGKGGQHPNERVEVVLTDEVMPDYSPTREGNEKSPTP